MIYNFYNRLFACLLVVFFSTSFNQAFALVQSGNIEKSAVVIDYSDFDSNELYEEADFLLDECLKSEDEIDKVDFMQMAMGKFYLLTMLVPGEIVPHVQLARLYELDKKNRLAKGYFSNAINIDKNNPFTNYYFGDFYYNQRKYLNALYHYTIAYQNGYENVYELNIKLATIYEKLAQIPKAREFYVKASLLEPNDKLLADKIRSLDEIIDTDYTSNEVKEEKLISNDGIIEDENVSVKENSELNVEEHENIVEEDIK